MTIGEMKKVHWGPFHSAVAEDAKEKKDEVNHMLIIGQNQQQEKEKRKKKQVYTITSSGLVLHTVSPFSSLTATADLDDGKTTQHSQHHFTSSDLGAGWP